MTRYYVLDLFDKKIKWYSDNKKECKKFIKAKNEHNRYVIFKEKWKER